MAAVISAQVAHVLFSLSAGGMENGVVNLAHALEGHGFTSQVICLEKPGEFVSRLPAASRVEVLSKRPGFSFATVSALRQTLARLRPQVVHSHNLGPLIYAALATGWGRMVPLVHGEHSELAEGDLTPRRWWQRKLFFTACRRVHTVSEGSAAQLRRVRLCRRATAIRNGVHTERFSRWTAEASRQLAGIPAEAQVIGLVGRFGPYKGHKGLLAAFALLAPAWPQLHLLLVGGGGPQEAEVREQVAASGFQHRIHLTGFTPQPEAYYPALDLLVVPSTNEGLSNVALEAMASGVPVLSHHACGAQELITSGEDGFVEDLGTPLGLAAALRALLAQPARLRAAGEKARATVAARFTMAAMAQAYARLYQEAAA